MIALVLAATVCSLVTLVLNAHFGWASSSNPFYAGMFAALSVAIDITKSAGLVAASRAWILRAYGIAALSLVLFCLSFTYSLYAGISQLTQDRASAVAASSTANATKGRTETQHARLASELKLMQQSPTFSATSACALPKSNEAKAFCAKVDRAAADLDRLSKELAINTASDPEPQVTLFAAFTGWDVARLKLTLALWPILLAELIGAIGFYLADRLKTARKATGTPQDGRQASSVTDTPSIIKTVPAVSPGRPGGISDTAPSIPARTPTLVWPEATQ